MSASLKTIIIIFILLSVGLASVFYFFIYSIPQSTEARTIIIETEYDNRALADRLKREGVISSTYYFRFNTWFRGQDIIVLPGSYHLPAEGSLLEIFNNFSNPIALYVDIPPGLDKNQMGKIFGQTLSWSESDTEFFSQTYLSMQWLEYQRILRDVFRQYFEWDDETTEAFMTLSSFYRDELDFLVRAYVPGRYLVPVNSSRAQVGAILINRFDLEKGTDFQTETLNFLDETAMSAVNRFVREEMEMLPDLIALPADDITLDTEGGKIYLRFTTRYWNDGQGPLELIAHPEDDDIGDIERDVWQRIYRSDGTFREKLVGNFLWHEPHLHYHFTDFAVYELTPIDNLEDNTPILNQKTTFCVRDIEPMDPSDPKVSSEAVYEICGKARQGISPGWVDTYYFSYADQNFDVTDLPSGTYRLSIIVNPENKFEEIDFDNNRSDVVLRLDMENVTVEIL